MIYVGVSALDSCGDCYMQLDSFLGRMYNGINANETVTNDENTSSLEVPLISYALSAQ